MDPKDSPSGPAPAQTGRGRLSPASGLFILVVCVGAAVVLWNRFFEDINTPHYEPAKRMYVCAETHKAFEHTLKTGEKSFPVMSPFTSKPTGYPAEACYCGKDKDGKPAPTWVLLDGYEKGDPQPTKCPACGATVTLHNLPKPGGSREGAGKASSAPSSAGG